MLDGGAAFLNRHRILIGDGLALQLFGSAAAGAGPHAHLEHHRGIGAEAANQPGHRAVEAGENRSDADDGADADNHAQHGQKGPNLVFAQRRERQADHG